MLCTCTTYAWSIMSFILNSPNTLCLIYIFFIISNQLCLHSAIISTLRWAPFSHTCWPQCCFAVKQSQMIFCWETSIFNERIGGSIVVSRTSDSLMCLLFDYTAAELWERKKKTLILCTINTKTAVCIQNEQAVVVVIGWYKKKKSSGGSCCVIKSVWNCQGRYGHKVTVCA